MHWLTRLAGLVALSACAFGCAFTYDPAGIVKYYRQEGWSLPGIASVGPFRTPPDLMDYPISSVPGVRALLVPQREYPFIVRFPAQVFMLDGKPKAMHAIQARTGIIRLETNGKDGAWKIDSEAACVFNTTFIDDTGDGVFPTLVPAMLNPSLVPAWVKAPKT